MLAWVSTSHNLTQATLPLWGLIFLRMEYVSQISPASLEGQESMLVNHGHKESHFSVYRLPSQVFQGGLASNQLSLDIFSAPGWSLAENQSKAKLAPGPRRRINTTTKWPGCMASRLSSSFVSSQIPIRCYEKEQRIDIMREADQH
jgi:hypothetical protein